MPSNSVPQSTKLSALIWRKKSDFVGKKKSCRRDKLLPDRPMSDLLGTPLHGIVIPSALILVGAVITVPAYTHYAVLLAVMLSAFKIWRGRTRRVLNPDQYQDFELSEKVVVSHNVAIYRFKLPNSTDILGLPIGQHITVAANINGRDITRSYTPISSDEDKGYFDLMIKSYPTGNISKYFGTLRIGETVKIKGPKGQMVYQPNLVRHFGMIAGGTGITPMLQIVRAILRNPGDKTEISLLFANVNEEDILLRTDLDDLMSEHANFKVHYVLNNPPEEWEGGVGFVTAEMIKEKCAPPAADMKMLICGPPPMVSAIKKAAVSLGYDAPRPVSKMQDMVFSF